MKTFSLLIVICFVYSGTALAQEEVWHQGIIETNINVRGNPVTVGQININVTSPGKVVVHFDGTCISDVGDRIMLAASDEPFWSPNDGQIGVEAVDSDVNRNPFSHTRVYDVLAGSHDFYAVAENAVEIGGSGIASIYASLTVEFFPDVPNAALVEHQGIIETNINVRGNPVTVGQININTTSPGKVVVHFDGVCTSDVGDRIMLAASDEPDWRPNDGQISVEAVDSDVNRNSFSHTRVYDVLAGSHDFYAVAENAVEIGGSGIASIYASLTVEFFPEIINEVQYFNEAPKNYSLEQNYPNPFNPATRIPYRISELSFVTLRVYDVLGREVAILMNEEKPVGNYEVEFSAQGGSASGGDTYNLPSGVYIYRLSAGNFTNSKKMMLLK
ncbi:T9SS type A sorting domain-containing protein [Bacteroidota bacterium]